MIKFNSNMTMLDCIKIASSHIKTCIKNKTSGVSDLNNQSKVLNRIAEYSVLIFVNRNYYRQFIITCDDEVMHYNKPLNTVIKKSVGVGELKASDEAMLLKQARKLIQVEGI